MALLLNYFDSRGTDFGIQYYRVDKVEVTRNKLQALIGLYNTEQEAKNGIPPHTVIDVDGAFDMYSDKNLWQQAYAAAKAQWPDAQDA